MPQPCAGRFRIQASIVAIGSVYDRKLVEGKLAVGCLCGDLTAGRGLHESRLATGALWLVCLGLSI